MPLNYRGYEEHNAPRILNLSKDPNSQLQLGPWCSHY